MRQANPSHKANANKNILSPDVSIIIPSYNRLPIIKEALNSVLSQEYNGITEIIVVDDGSEDGTPECIAEQYPDVCVVSLKQNIGNYAARNQGLKVARGQHIAFLDSDDLWRPNYLQVQLEALTDHPRSIALSGFEIWDARSGKRETYSPKPDLDKHLSPMHQMLLYARHYLASGPSALVFPRSVFDEIGFFNERHRVGADVDLYLRCLGAGFDTIFTELPVFVKRSGLADQLTDPKNIRIRELSVRSRVDHFYRHYGMKSRYLVPPIRIVHVENSLAFADIHFYSCHDLLSGLTSCLIAAKHGSPVRALVQAVAGIRHWLTITLRYKHLILLSKLKKFTL
jgi:glycosyltransferase involved in cell wall biosynthesis